MSRFFAAVLTLTLIGTTYAIGAWTAGTRRWQLVGSVIHLRWCDDYPLGRCEAARLHTVYEQNPFEGASVIERISLVVVLLLIGAFVAFGPAGAFAWAALTRLNAIVSSM